MGTILPAWFNFLALVGFLGFKLRAPTRDFVTQRHFRLKDELTRVREQLKAAQEKYDEFSAKLKAIDAEIRALREESRQDAVTAKLRIVNQAKASSVDLLANARTSASALYSDLKADLMKDLSMRVLQTAEAILRERLTRDDRVRIRNEFSRQVESIRQ